MKIAVWCLGLFLSSHGLIAHGQSVVQSWLTSAGPVEGRVLDYATEQPIAGAVVIATWTDNLPGWGQRTVCIHAETAAADGSGRYRLEQGLQRSYWGGTGSLILYAYKPGYVSASNRWDYVGGPNGIWEVYRLSNEPMTVPPTVVQSYASKEAAAAAAHPYDVYLNPFKGSSDQRFEYLNGPAVTTIQCWDGGASRKNLYPALRAIYAEAKPLAVTDKQKRLLGFLRRDAIDAWLAPSKGTPASQRPPIPDQVLRELE